MDFDRLMNTELSTDIDPSDNITVFLDIHTEKDTGTDRDTKKVFMITDVRVPLPTRKPCSFFPLFFRHFPQTFQISRDQCLLCMQRNHVWKKEFEHERIEKFCKGECGRNIL